MPESNSAWNSGLHSMLLEKVLSNILTAPGILTAGLSQVPAPSGSQSSTLKLSNIPIANEGDIITSEYHNSLRAAVLALAARLGMDDTNVVRTLTFAPTFLKNGDSEEWFMINGIASLSAGREGNGLLFLSLPQGMRLSSLTIHGKKEGDVESFFVTLFRSSVDKDNPSVILSVPLEDVPDGDFSITRSVIPSEGDISPAVLAAAEALRRIDNQKFKYLLRAEAEGVANVVEIRSFQFSLEN